MSAGLARAACLGGCGMCLGEKLKAMFIEHGNFKEVEVQVRRWHEVRERKETTAKPVSKLQLKNVYHYDESPFCIHCVYSIYERPATSNVRL